MKKAVVCGAAGFIGQHLVARLQADGYYVIGLSRRLPIYNIGRSDLFVQCDLREYQGEYFNDVDEVYQMAGEVGGLGYITDRANDATMLRNTTLIDINVLEACRKGQVGKVFFASSACVYPDIARPMREVDAYPAQPLNEFAWQKVFAEHLYAAYARQYGVNTVIGRLFNTYGPGMPWVGGREKSVAALCRKVAELPNDGALEVWGNGQQRRSYTYVDDTVSGIRALMQSDHPTTAAPFNIGYTVAISIRDMVEAIGHVAGKAFTTFYQMSAPVGVKEIVADCFNMEQLTGWKAKTSVIEGLKKTYPWVAAEVDRARKAA